MGELPNIEPVVQSPSFENQPVGRLVTVLTQLRNLMVVGSASLANGDETSLLAAGGTGIFHDLVHIVGSNTSDAAITIDIRDSLAGTIRFKLTIPASDTKEIHFPHPWPQNSAVQAWTADMGDFTTTTINLYVLAAKNKK